MRKLLLALGVLLSLGMFSACSSDDEVELESYADSSDDSVKFIPIEEGDGYAAIRDFFNKELPFGENSKGFFVGSNKNVGEEACKIIRSKKEFEENYSGDKDIPVIDFQQYTIIIGQIIMPVIGYKCVKQEILSTTKNKSAVLNLYVKNIYEYNPQAIKPLYFWGLYPCKHLSGIANIKINIIKL